MILAVSTSSPTVSVAIIDPAKREVVCAASKPGDHKASGRSLELIDALLNQASISLKDIELFVADLGPGSFTGVKVGVTVAKTFAYTHNRHVAGVSAFDLIGEGNIAISSRKNEWYLRQPGQEVKLVKDLPKDAMGYRVAAGDTHPDCARVLNLLDQLTPVSPVELVPEYGSEPSISKPKKHLGLGGAK